MDIKTFVLEILELIKKEKFIILLSAVVVTILTVAIHFVAVFDYGKNNNEVLENISAQLDMYIEQENLGAFANSYLLETLVTEPEVVEEISTSTNVDIMSVLNRFSENNEPIYSTEDPINIERNTSSNIMSLTVNVGSDEENLKVADAYYNWFDKADSPFFQDKDVFLINEPELINDSLNSNQSNSISIKTTIIWVILGLIFGIVIGLMVAVLKVIFSDIIKYSFTYGWNSNDIYIKEKQSTPVTKIAHSILSSQADSLAILTEKTLSSELINEISKFNSKNFVIYNDIANISIDSNIEEFIFIVERNKTTKKWYIKQRNDLKLYPNSRVKIVEIEK
ncbi:hypothetical protein ACEN32_09930 [Marinilactibacillus psychrotolerans]|uniref:hypothetical protein n=1 Tax=Marinilactibacillus psychrotolerans TaxID=191770 RepID=UPI003887B3EA